MQADELKEHLAQPSYELFVDNEAGIDLSREVGLSVGSHVFADDDPNRIISGVINLEAYFHHLRSAALQALKQRLSQGYAAITAILQNDGELSIVLGDGTILSLPGHTAPALNELLTRAQPAAGYDNPRLCLELIQQTGRLMEVLGHTRLAVQSEDSQDIVHRAG